MTDKIVVLVTAGSLREAKTIARHLIESCLAACVNVSQPVRSIYQWKGKIVEDREVLLFIKTKRSLFAEVRETILENHSYTTPEIISLPVTDGSPPYLRWIEESVKKPKTRRARPPLRKNRPFSR